MRHAARLLLLVLWCVGMLACGGSRTRPVAPNDPRFRSFIFERYVSSADRPAPLREPEEAPRSQEQTAVTARGASHPNWLALVVGIEGYAGIARPEGARRDAEQFAELAETALGVPHERVHVLLDDQATRNRIEQAVSWLKDNASRHSTIIFYFAGHGAADRGVTSSNPEPFIMPYDADPLDVVTTAIAVPQLIERLRASPAQQVVAFLDACYSGTGGRSVASKNRAIVRERVLGAEKTAVFSASQIDQVAGPNAGGKGLFTSTIIEGINSLNADLDGDRNLTLQELSDWVAPRVERDAHRAHRDQKPYLSMGADVRAKDVLLMEGLAR